MQNREIVKANFKLGEFNAQFRYHDLTIFYNQLLFSTQNPITSIVADFSLYLRCNYTIPLITDQCMDTINQLRMLDNVDHRLLAFIDSLHIISLGTHISIAENLAMLSHIHGMHTNKILRVLYDYTLRCYRNSLLAHYRDEIYKKIIGNQLMLELEKNIDDSAESSS